MKSKYVSLKSAIVILLLGAGLISTLIVASSHREAPLIANDPLADVTDVYAFRSPDNPNTVTLIANYVPLQLPEGGPNYASFGENIRYQIHIDNNAETAGEEIIYRFTFTEENEDPSTFFNIRLGKQNLKKTYMTERSIDGGQTWDTIIDGGIVPPPNIGPRSIEDATVGLGTTYEALIANAITTASTGETIYAGPADDPFFVDLGGIFDVGMTRAGGAGSDAPRDGVAGFNVSTIAIQVPIATLQKNGYGPEMAESILDPNYVIGVWASAWRQQTRVLNTDGSKPTYSGDWVQVSRLGNPLLNEAVIPIGYKDQFNAQSPYGDLSFADFLTNPELALYMDDDQFGGAVPAFSQLRIQKNSLGAFDFTNGANGLFGLADTVLEGTALHPTAFGGLLLQEGKPRSVDILPIFLTGAPNLRPYQLATGKGGDPLAEGKPFVNNFLPTLADMLRLNMAVPPTPRDDDDFSTLGLVQAAVLGLTDPRFTASADLEFIPNMDGFPNGRRLEDDVTRIELQAVSGVVLAALGLWYDDYDPSTSTSPVTQGLLNVLSYSAGPEANDLPLKTEFPYVATPHRGYDYDKQTTVPTSIQNLPALGLGISVPKTLRLEQNYPNPFNPTTQIAFNLERGTDVQLKIFDMLGREVATLVDGFREAGSHNITWAPRAEATGVYFARMTANKGAEAETIKLTLMK